MRQKVFVASMSMLGLLAASAIGLLVLQNFPNSGDEWCYLLQAEMFIQGRLSVPSPPHREFFHTGWMINNGKFYTHHPPGWPLVLATGVWAGVPWLVNPLLGALTLLVVYALGKRMYQQRVATIALLCTLGSPFFLVHSASYWPHSSSLLFLSLSLLGFVAGLSNRSLYSPVLGGLSGSLSFFIRPLEQVILLLACGMFCLLPAQRQQHGLRAGSVFCLTHLLGVLLLLGYHTLQHGHPLVTGYEVSYGAQGAANMRFTFPTWHYIDDYFFDLVWWTVPGMPLVAVGYLLTRLRQPQPDTQGRHWDVLLVLICAWFMIMYAMVVYPPWVGYGPRYYYSGFFAVALLTARGVEAFLASMSRRLPARQRRMSLTIGGGAFLLAFVVMWVWHLHNESTRVQGRMAFQRLIAAQAVHHAVVFIATQSADFEPLDLTRNRLDFQGDVIYALDRGEDNQGLMAHYPGRRSWLYAYDETQARNTLRELRPPAPDGP